jgi:(E)-4-hydroxy-3-methylbut-2-enyl-diphosphate synthase
MNCRSFCPSPISYQRRLTRHVVVGNPARGGVVIGGVNPVVVQSMIACDTMDTPACVRQTLDLVAAGCQMVRITAPTVKAAANLKHIVAELRAQNCWAPVVADIHFKPEAALEAAQWVEKVRINPGNFADTKKFARKEYTDAQYAAELRRIEARFAPLVQLCKALGRAMRIGANHGSLSDRILNRFGDTPLGMVESALEFARIARNYDFHNFCFSLKASNPKVMIQSYRLLVARLDELGPDWNYPLHLGVTEAGEGEDGRIKSAIGIGSLLADGLGDTIRVSLTEDSTQEIPVCQDLLGQIPALTAGATVNWRLRDSSAATSSEVARTPASAAAWPFDPFSYERRRASETALPGGTKCGGDHTVRVVASRAAAQKVARRIKPQDDVRPEAIYEELGVCEIDPTTDFNLDSSAQLVTVKDGLDLPAIAAFRMLAAKLNQRGLNNPILLKDCLVAPASPLEPRIALLRASVVIGSLLADGIGDGVLVRSETDAWESLRLALNILQAVGCRSFKTDYVACPSCGRTLFNLQTVTAQIKARTQHLKGVKLAIMGCIVNGPGEMADADFGYVGGAPGKVNLYVGKTAVRFNIPEAEAVNRLVDLIREHGKWREP